MGSMNAMGHAIAAGAGGDVDELWELLDEMARRKHGDRASVGMHSSFGPLGDGVRYCVHVGVNGPGPHLAAGMDLAHTLALAATQFALEMDPDDLWRRE